MTMFPETNNNRGQKGLKSPVDRSHNQTQLEAQIKALVEHLARQAAEEDFKMLQDALRSSRQIKQDGSGL